MTQITMKSHQVESWALRVIDQVKKGQPNEDFKVELKSQWPTDCTKAARQIAGHANAAHSEPILWLIGVDQTNGIVGVNHAELANWYPQIKSQFDGLAPDLTDLNIPVDDKTVAALLFDTTRAPFVIRNPEFGVRGGVSISLEVPWRDGTSTRTANRSELLTLLSPFQFVPAIELLRGELLCHRHPNGNSFEWYLTLHMYVVPQTEKRLVIPFYRCETAIEFTGSLPRLVFPQTTLEPSKDYDTGYEDGISQSLTIKDTITETIIDGPGLLLLYARTQTPIHRVTFADKEVEIASTLRPVGIEAPITINMTLKPHKDNRPRKVDLNWSRGPVS